MGADRTSGEGLASMVAAQLAAFICDEGGKPLLSQDEAAQLVDRWAAHQVQAVIRAGVKLNALGESSVEDAGGN